MDPCIMNIVWIVKIIYVYVISLQQNPNQIVIVIGITNNRGSIDPSLRRAGRFGCEVEIGVPTAAQRREVSHRSISNPMSGSHYIQWIIVVMLLVTPLTCHVTSIWKGKHLSLCCRTPQGKRWSTCLAPPPPTCHPLQDLGFVMSWKASDGWLQL